jgi:hypothetical protein
MNTDKISTNRPSLFTKGYPKEYIKENFDNKLEPADDFIIDLSRLFLGINGAINPYQQALTFANYLIRNGTNLLPSVILFFVDKFRTLPEAIQDYVIQNTPQENNYFRKDGCSDKVAFLARLSQYNTNSSLVPAPGREQPVGLGMSERIANKISPAHLRNVVELVRLTNEVTIRSQPTTDSYDKYVGRLTGRRAHNMCKNIVPTLKPRQVWEKAQPTILQQAAQRFGDLWRIFQYKLNHRPYDPEQREDIEQEYIIDKNLDTQGPASSSAKTIGGYTIDGYYNMSKEQKLYELNTRIAEQNLKTDAAMAKGEALREKYESQGY